MDEEIIVSDKTRPCFLKGMADVADRLFSMILEGYISTLRAVVDWSNKRGEIGDVSKHNSAQIGLPTPPNLRLPGTTRDSLSAWTKALLTAQQAQDALCNCNQSSVKAWDADGEEGLCVLEKSVSYLAKVASYPELADLDQEQLMKEVEQVVTSRCTP